MGCLEAALTLDGTLPKKERKKRAVFFYLHAASLATCLVGSMAMKEYLQGQFLSVIGQTVFALTAVVSMYVVLSKRALSNRVIVAASYTNAFALYLTDLVAFSKGPSTTWPLLVVVVDLMLVMEVPTRYSLLLVCCTVFWLFLMGLEKGFRFGIWDLPGTVSQENRRELAERMYSCDSLPCAVPALSLEFIVTSISVFTLDFIVTRGFARDVLVEQTAMQKTIEAVQEIASLLAMYDVDGVARMLKMREAELPEQMYETLQTMEQNLRMYRPYLPAALFEEMEVDECGESKRRSVAPPGVLSETATIVFTDIRSSTWIWEHAPEGMRAGLKIHNSVMREVMQAFGGYEVKTIGDAFMIAFTSTQDGVNFGLRVHELLREAVWPESLLEDAPICAEQGSLWGGLTVRIGVNTGPVTVEQATLTGRTDYFGHTVNVASRLESTCKPGAVAVPSDLYTSECGSCSAVVGDAEALDLKGVSGTTFVQCVWPLSLAGRKYSELGAPIPQSEKPRDNISESFGTSSGSSMSSLLRVAPCSLPTKTSEATVGQVQFGLGEVGGTALQLLSARLATLTVSLDQSRGTLVSLLGNRVCVGWNLTRPAPAHMENAVRFAQRILGIDALAGAGLATGPVNQGTVAARTQRFVTVVGQSVQRSWALCDEAVLGGGLCLYEAPAGSVLPSVFNAVMAQHNTPGIYTVLPMAERGFAETLELL